MGELGEYWIAAHEACGADAAARCPGPLLLHVLPPRSSRIPVEALRQACTYDALPVRGLADSAALTSDVVQFHRRKRESPPPYEGSTAGSEESGNSAEPSGW